MKINFGDNLSEYTVVSRAYDQGEKANGRELKEGRWSIRGA